MYFVASVAGCIYKLLTFKIIVQVAIILLVFPFYLLFSCYIKTTKENRKIKNNYKDQIRN